MGETLTKEPEMSPKPLVLGSKVGELSLPHLEEELRLALIEQQNRVLLKNAIARGHIALEFFD